MKRLLLASGNTQLNKEIVSFSKVEVVGTVNFREELAEACKYFKPDVLFVSDELGGTESLYTMLLVLHAQYPSMQIIYWTGADFARNQSVAIQLGTLASVGIYDIIVEKVNAKIILQRIEFPNKRDDVNFFIEKLEKANKKAESSKKSMEVEAVDSITSYASSQSIISFYSAKPGTGKTTLAINTALAIAMRGEHIDGHPPKVLLLEADLQNLSVGTALNMHHENKNLETALLELQKIIINDNIIVNEEKIEEAEAVIMRCITPHPVVSNLHVLCDSRIKQEVVDEVRPNHYMYLFDLVKDQFDIIIVDANSSLDHITSAPVFNNSHQCFYISNLDFNNVSNAMRYKELLRQSGFSKELRFVLNEYISPTHRANQVEKLQFTAEMLEEKAGFRFEGRVPLIEKTIFYNRMFEGIPIMLDEFSYLPTAEFRLRVLELAQIIHPVSGIEELTEQLDEIKNREGKRGLSKLFGK